MLSIIKFTWRISALEIWVSPICQILSPIIKVFNVVLFGIEMSDGVDLEQLELLEADNESLRSYEVLGMCVQC